MKLFQFGDKDQERSYLELMVAIDKNDGTECAELPDIFFPVDWELGTQSNNALAKQICKRCPVQLQCLEYAMIAEDEAGTWGGLTAIERRQLRSLSRQGSKPS